MKKTGNIQKADSDCHVIHLYYHADGNLCIVLVWLLLQRADVSEVLFQSGIC